MSYFRLGTEETKVQGTQGTLASKEEPSDTVPLVDGSAQSQKSRFWVWLACLAGITFGFANFWLGETSTYSPIKVKLYMSYGVLSWGVIYIIFVGC